MRRHLPSALAVVVPLVLGLARAAGAAPPSSSGATPSASVGWGIAIVSAACGAAITSVSLTVDCSRDDPTCARWASVGIWSGIGVASIGAVVGLLVVRSATRPPPVRISVSFDALRPASSTPHATVVYVF